MISQFGIIVFQLALHVCIGVPLEMKIYYETLCPSSQELFINQLQPNFEQFANSINFVLIPYGNAKTDRDSSGKVVGITCQHYELECRGNALQGCALKKIPDTFTQLRFCICFMVNKGDCAAFQKCTQTYGIDYNMLNTCTANGEGLNYLASYGDIHNQAYPKIDGVPTIALNGKQLTEQENKDFYSNCCKFLCDKIPDQKPQACNTCPPPSPAPPTLITS